MEGDWVWSGRGGEQVEVFYIKVYRNIPFGIKIFCLIQVPEFGWLDRPNAISAEENCLAWGVTFTR